MKKSVTINNKKKIKNHTFYLFKAKGVNHGRKKRNIVEMKQFVLNKCAPTNAPPPL